MHTTVKYNHTPQINVTACIAADHRPLHALILIHT